MENPLREQHDYGGNQIDKNIQTKIEEIRNGEYEIDQFGKICSQSLEMKMIASQVAKRRRCENPITRPEHECSKSCEDGYESEVYTDE